MGKINRAPVIFRIVCTVLLLNCIVWLSACSPTLHSGSLQGPATMTMKVNSTINGMRRTALVHLPGGYTKGKSYPLVVVLHGAFSKAEDMERETGFSILADREGFVVLYPEGMGLFGFLQHWNAGHCCGKAARDNIDDVAFIDEGIDKLATMVNIDRRRVYVAGFSNGGMLAYRYAAERSEEVAAFAALAAAVGGRRDRNISFWLPPLPKRPVPAFIVHGLADAAVPAQGGASSVKGGGREYFSLGKSIDFWLQANGCTKMVEVLKTRGGAVTAKTWPACSEGSEVRLYTLADWHHRWPGPYFTSGSKNLDGFDITKPIWQFFQRFSLPEKSR